MKKFIAFVAVCGFALAFVACGKKAETAETTQDSAAVAPAVDSAAAPAADSAAVPVDSAAH